MKADTYERVNITLPKSTLKLIDGATKKGNRSGFINEAIAFYLKNRTQQSLRERLKEGYIAQVQESLKMVREAEAADDELWDRLYKDEK